MSGVVSVPNSSLEKVGILLIYINFVLRTI